jgi:hypothetical protein
MPTVRDNKATILENWDAYKVLFGDMKPTILAEVKLKIGVKG